MLEPLHERPVRRGPRVRVLRRRRRHRHGQRHKLGVVIRKDVKSTAQDRPSSDGHCGTPMRRSSCCGGHVGHLGSVDVNVDEARAHNVSVLQHRWPQCHDCCKSLYHPLLRGRKQCRALGLAMGSSAKRGSCWASRVTHWNAEDLVARASHQRAQPFDFRVRCDLGNGALI